MQERAEVQWKFRFALFSHPNSEPEVDINFYYGFENHINLERGSLDIYEHYVLVKMSVQVSVLRGNHALFSIHGNLILWAMCLDINPLLRFPGPSVHVTAALSPELVLVCAYNGPRGMSKHWLPV